jgi:hypothetical protein
MTTISTRETAARVTACWAEGFSSLGLNASPKELRRAFKRLLAVTVRYAGQLTGQAAWDLATAWLVRLERKPLTAAERELLEFRYGACRALGDINVGLVFGCGPLLGDLVNDYFLGLAGVLTSDERLQAEEHLQFFLILLGQFQRRRKQARAQERRDDRLHYADHMPQGTRQQAESEPDNSLPAPDQQAALKEQMELLEAILPQLKERDVVRLRAFIDSQGDRKAAAAKLGIDHATYTRQLRQTVFPAVRRAARHLVSNDDE